MCAQGMGFQDQVDVPPLEEASRRHSPVRDTPRTSLETPTAEEEDVEVVSQISTAACGEHRGRLKCELPHEHEHIVVRECNRHWVG